MKKMSFKNFRESFREQNKNKYFTKKWFEMLSIF